jgi:hypothetical protein
LRAWDTASKAGFTPPATLDPASAGKVAETLQALASRRSKSLREVKSIELEVARELVHQAPAMPGSR